MRAMIGCMIERRCERFRADGIRCDHVTANRDGWCRASDCPGFVRATTASAPQLGPADDDGADDLDPPRRAPLRPAMVDLGVETVAEVVVTTRAIDSFRFHHGGSAAAARTQLRSMLAEFLLESKKQTDGHYYLLSRRGYWLVLSPDRSAITGYRTVHRERTWEQVERKVPSRFVPTAVRKDGAARPAAPEPGSALPASQIPSAVDPATVYFTGRARGEFVKIRGFREIDAEGLDAAIRDAARGIAESSHAVTRDDGLIVVVSDEMQWLIRPDALVIISVKRLAPDAASPQARVASSNPEERS